MNAAPPINRLDSSAADFERKLAALLAWEPQQDGAV